MLSKLNLQEKLIIIMGDNASNNETIASELLHSLIRTASDKKRIQFQRLDSYIRCLAHILNLIVKDILQALESGTPKEADTICDRIQDGRPISI
jgi:hypothetical protein